ncbi:MAG: hypothetical protein QOD92_197 [Acidimicrobiaceae bacterium]|jgi:hypothetical protein
MKYMLLIYTDPSAFNPADGEKIMGEYMAFTQEILDSGEMVAGDPLEAAETATSVRVRDGKRATTDGPFAETKEVLGGYYIVDVKDLDRAVELAGKIPDARTGSVEVRPVVNMA